MKIVVTGALGHIGSGLIREIPKRFKGAEVLLMDNLLTQRYCSLFELPAGCAYRFLESDVLQADLPRLFTNADAVIHLAAVTNAEKSFEMKSEVEAVNYGGTQKVADACAKAGCPMIFISTTSVYGTQNRVVDENCSEEELKPQSPYAETKLREEKYLTDLVRDCGLRATICRFGTICGVSPGMRFHTAVNKFCWQAAMGESLTVWRTALHQLRPYLTLTDAIPAIFHIVERDLFEGGVYNVLTGNLTVNDIVNWIRERISGVDIRHVDASIMNQLSYEVANDKFRGTGFQFKGDFRKCIHETIDLLKGAFGGTRGN